MKFDFAMSGEDGKELKPLFGPGLTGLRNLGNSCYMASVLQVLFALPSFSDRYLTQGSAHALMCQNTNPASCFEAQLLATGNADPEADELALCPDEDPDIDSPIPSEQLTTSSSTTSAVTGPSADAIAMVTDMGFTPNQARKALNETSGNIEAAVEWLFSNPGDPGFDEAAVTAQLVGASGKALSRGSANLRATYRLRLSFRPKAIPSIFVTM